MTNAKEAKEFVQDMQENVFMLIMKAAEIGHAQKGSLSEKQLEKMMDLFSQNNPVKTARWLIKSGKTK